jgi:PHD/YefM family antitoxin component YafN of YafNO toxin-antitoxin module
MTRAGTSFRALHDQVIARQSRIEITRPGSDDACILISKRELESLEQAIAILAHTEYFQQLCRSLQDLLQSAGMVYSGANEPLVQSGANEG